MAAFAWGRRWGYEGSPTAAPATAPGTTRPMTATDDERAAYDRLGPASWWRWANRGRYEPRHPWEHE